MRHVTLAPELPGYPALAALVREAGAVVAVGHSDADHATAADAFAAGAGSATHLFNAMRPWEHRGSSVVSAALAAAARGRVVVELVADGTHVDAGTTAAVLGLVPGQVALVSDAVPPAGLPDGDHALGAVRVQVRGGVARTADGAIAGGAGGLLDVSASPSCRRASPSPGPSPRPRACRPPCSAWTGRSGSAGWPRARAATCSWWTTTSARSRCGGRDASSTSADARRGRPGRHAGAQRRSHRGNTADTAPA